MSPKYRNIVSLLFTCLCNYNFMLLRYFIIFCAREARASIALIIECVQFVF